MVEYFINFKVPNVTNGVYQVQLKRVPGLQRTQFSSRTGGEAHPRHIYGKQCLSY